MDEMTFTEQELDLDALRGGDKAAFARLVEVYADRIYNLALKLVGHPQEAEDIVQETFLSAFKHIGQFEGRSQLGTWLYRIAHNAALMRLRKKEPDAFSMDEPLAMDDGELVPRQFFDWCCLPERDLLSAEAQERMDAAIGELPESLRVVFVLRDIEGLSTEEAAEALDLSAAAIKSRLHRARLFLRERLAVYFSDWAQERGYDV